MLVVANVENDLAHVEDEPMLKKLKRYIKCPVYDQIPTHAQWTECKDKITISGQIKDKHSRESLTYNLPCRKKFQDSLCIQHSVLSTFTQVKKSDCCKLVQINSNVVSAIFSFLGRARACVPISGFYL